MSNNIDHLAPDAEHLLAARNKKKKNRNKGKGKNRSSSSSSPSSSSSSSSSYSSPSSSSSSSSSYSAPRNRKKMTAKQKAAQKKKQAQKKNNKNNNKNKGKNNNKNKGKNNNKNKNKGKNNNKNNNKNNQKVKTIWVSHAGERVSGVATVSDPVMITDAPGASDVTSTRTSTTINNISGTLDEVTTEQNDVKYVYRMVTANELNGHSTDTTSSPVEWVGTGKSKHQERIKNKHIITLKKKVIHKVKHKVPTVKTISIAKKIKPGQDSTIERVFATLLTPDPYGGGIAFQYIQGNYCGLSVDRAVSAPTGRAFKAQKTKHKQKMQQRNALRAAAVVANDVFHCAYFGQPDSYMTSSPIVKFVLPHGNTGADDPYSVTNVQESTTTKTNVQVVDHNNALEGLKKVLKYSNAWTRDFYNGMFILNDEPVNMRYTTGSYLSTDDLQLTDTGFVLYLRRSYGANGTNAKLATYSDAVWFSNQNTSHDIALRSAWNSGTYIWQRTSVVVNGALVTSYHVRPCPSDGGYMV